jgi:hypothetical protein
MNQLYGARNCFYVIYFEKEHLSIDFGSDSIVFRPPGVWKKRNHLTLLYLFRIVHILKQLLNK